MFGEIFAGLLAGPLILGVVGETEAITVLAELGIFFLMFHSGLETDLNDLRRSAKKAIFVAIGGMLIPFAGGFWVSTAYGYDLITSLFVALIVSITAVVISARLFKDAKISRTKVAHVVISAAIMAEIVTLILFSVFLTFTRSGVFEMQELIIQVAKFIAYFAIVFYVGAKYFKHLYRVFYKGNKGFTFSIILALTMGVIAEYIGLHMIIGAFLAGLFLHEDIIEEKVYKKIEDRVFGLSYSFLGPIFFATLAFHIDLEAFYTLPGFMILLFLVAFIGKIVGSGLPAYLGDMNSAQSLAVGLAMNSRGAVDLIIISLAFEEGIIGTELFSVLVIVAFASTFISVVGIKPLINSISTSYTQLFICEEDAED